MKTKTILAAIALTLTPTIGMAMGCGDGHSKQAATCVAGTSWDADKGACVANPTG